jgi:hypothetical protein
MKRWVLILIVSLQAQIGSCFSTDTTGTTFEIHLKRKSDNPLGFNTNSIDRKKIYEAVIKQLGNKIHSPNFYSLQNPDVVMKFQEYVSTKTSRGELSLTEKRALNQHHFNYFVKIFGYLDIDSPLNQFQKATFTLRVYVFDASGNLIAKSRARSIYRDSDIINTQQLAHPVNENEFLELVADAATSLELGM